MILKEKMENRNMDELWYKNVSYEDAKDLLKESLVNTVGSFIASGYWLKYIRDNKLYEEEGYSSLWEMAEKEFALKKSEASRAMSMNDKYSVGGNSPIMLEQYREYNKSQLQEMLTMTEEQLKQVTADIKIQELRKIKKKPEVRGLCDDAYCSECGAELVDPDCGQEDIVCPECGQAVDWSDYPGVVSVENVATSQEPVSTVSDGILEAEIVEEIIEDEEVEEEFVFEVLEQEEDAKEPEVIVDGEFRELPVEEVTDVLSAYGLSKTEYPEESSISTKGCGHKYSCFCCAKECGMRQEKRYCIKATMGNPFECTTMNVLELLKEEMGDVCQFVNHELANHTQGSNEARPCCNQCKETLCGYRCNKSEKPKDVILEIDEVPVAAVEESEMEFIKRILQKEQQLLNEYLEIEDLPVFTVKKQKVIVGALANMVCELEAMDEVEKKEQPELLPMSNNDKRKEFIDAYESWPIWLEQPQTGERYYRYEFKNGTAFVVKTYFHKCFDYHAKGNWEERYRDAWGAEEYYIITEGKHFKDCLTNKSCMVEFLKGYQKGEK